MDSIILSILSSFTEEMMSKKQIKQELEERQYRSEKKEKLSEVLQSLEEKGLIEQYEIKSKKAKKKKKKKDSKKDKIKVMYKLSSSSSKRSISASALSCLPDKEPKEEKALTFSEMMKRKQKNVKNSEVSFKKEEGTETSFDIDDEIKRLEAQLQNGDNSEDDLSSASSESKSEEKGEADMGVMSESEEKGEANMGVICISEVADDVIQPLPSNSLPSNKRRKLKNIDGADSDDGPPVSKRQKKEHQKKLMEERNGLKEAVKEILDGYVERSKSSESKKLPFYCRVCDIQSVDMDAFLEHKKSKLHLAAVEAERKACFCRLCRKQFTSLKQMKEHLGSRPHREKMDYVQEKQRGFNNATNRGRGRGGAPGRQRNASFTR